MLCSFFNFSVVLFLCSWTYLIRRLDLRTAASMTGESGCFSLQPVIVNKEYLVSACDLCQHTMTLCFLSDRDLQIESLKRDLELLRAELERVKAEVRTAGTESLAVLGLGWFFMSIEDGRGHYYLCAEESGSCVGWMQVLLLTCGMWQVASEWGKTVTDTVSTWEPLAFFVCHSSFLCRCSCVCIKIRRWDLARIKIWRVLK